MPSETCHSLPLEYISCVQNMLTMPPMEPGDANKAVFFNAGEPHPTSHRKWDVSLHYMVNTSFMCVSVKINVQSREDNICLGKMQGLSKRA